MLTHRHDSFYRRGSSSLDGQGAQNDFNQSKKAVAGPNVCASVVMCKNKLISFTHFCAAFYDAVYDNDLYLGFPQNWCIDGRFRARVEH